MTKIVCLVSISLLLAGTLLTGFSLAAHRDITKNDLPALKGAWKGVTMFNTARGATSSALPTTLELYNDTLPLKGKLTIQVVPQEISALFVPPFIQPIDSVTIEFDNGTINAQGVIFVSQGVNSIELALFTGKTMSMTGSLYYRDLEANLAFHR